MPYTGGRVLHSLGQAERMGQRPALLDRVRERRARDLQGIQEQQRLDIQRQEAESTSKWRESEVSKTKQAMATQADQEKRLKAARESMPVRPAQNAPVSERVEWLRQSSQHMAMAGFTQEAEQIGAAAQRLHKQSVLDPRQEKLQAAQIEEMQASAAKQRAQAKQGGFAPTAAGGPKQLPKTPADPSDIAGFDAWADTAGIPAAGGMMPWSGPEEGQMSRQELMAEAQTEKQNAAIGAGGQQREIISLKVSAQRILNRKAVADGDEQPYPNAGVGRGGASGNLIDPAGLL